MSTPGGSITSEERDILRIVGKSWGWVLFFGIVTLALGVVVTIRPRDTIYAFAILLGIWLFVAGLFRIVAAIADRDDTGGTRWLMALLGLLSVIVGILFLHRTDETVTTLAFLIGLFWVVGGIIEFFTAYSEYGSPARGWRIGMGVLAFAAGVVTLVWPNLTLTALAVIIGIWLIIYGLLEVALSFQLRRLA
ncbi:MAG TPA: HdeD family acid-resistance protein, partial [Acidimicrobiales bacterium]|nr:HdeD family acid-resistance protein [Acidimicrobiales bacterium]